MKVKSESEVVQSFPTLSDPMDCSYQAPPSMGFSRQEYLSGLPLPFPDLKGIIANWRNMCHMKGSLFSSDSGNANLVGLSLSFFQGESWSSQFYEF